MSTELQIEHKSDTLSLKNHILNVQYDSTLISNFNYTLNLEEIPNLKLDFNKRLIIIDSILSGTGRENKNFYLNVIKPILDSLNIKYEYLKTESKDSIAIFAKEKIPNDSVVALLSGDTSIFELINNSPSDLSIELFPIPLGTGNGLASSMKIDNEFIGFQILLSYLESSVELKRLPIYKVEFPEDSHFFFEQDKKASSLLFTVVCSWGCHSKVVYLSETPELRKLGIERFKIAAAQTLAGDINYNGIVSENPSFGCHNYITILAIQNFEKTYKISPDSNVFRNELHLLDVGGETNETSLSNAELFEFSMKPYNNGAHVLTDDKRVVYKKIEKDLTLTFTTDDESKSIFCIDGLTIIVKNPKDKSVKVKYLNENQVVNIKVPFLE